MSKRSRIIIELESFYIICGVIGIVTALILLTMLNKNVSRLIYMLSGTTTIFVLFSSGAKIRIKKFEIENGVLYKNRIPGEKEPLEIDNIDSIEKVGFLNEINENYKISVPKTFRKVEIKSSEKGKMVVPKSFYDEIEGIIVSNKI